jgi:hypothetical protein
MFFKRRNIAESPTIRRFGWDFCLAYLSIASFLQALATRMESSHDENNSRTPKKARGPRAEDRRNEKNDLH